MHIRWFIISFRKYTFLRNTIITILILWLSYSLMKVIFNLLLSPSSTPATILSKKLLEKYKILNQKQKVYNTSEIRQNNKIIKLTEVLNKQRTIFFTNDSITFANHNIHIFYYAWYGNIKFDNDWNHWNHNYIPNWKKNAKTKIHRKKHEPPLDIGSNYYPLLGCYSSRDTDIIKIQMKQLKFAGVGVLVISWTPPGMKDSPHDILPSLFYYASEQNIKVTLHIEPYFNRNPDNIKNHLINFFDNYFNHPALYKIKTTISKKPLPLIYIYDSYLIPFSAWRELLNIKGNISIRGTEYDAIFIGLLVDQQHRYHIKKSQFDGFYTYFASNGFSYGSTWKNWNPLAKFARQNHLIFIPSVAPGYIDTQIRPWNIANTRHRRHGQYYDVAWRSAIANNVEYISITSFNEWHEGTQIEPVQSRTRKHFTYLDYNPEGSDFYLNLTKWWVNTFFHSKENHKNLI